MDDDKGAGAVIDRLFGALAVGDVDAAKACFTPDGRVWHSFDGIAHDREAAAEGWAGFIAAFPERAFIDVRRQSTATGCVQQHLMVVRSAAGARKAWPICIVLHMAGGLIARLEEYMDRAGAFTPAENDAVPTTPGLA